jgi:hypothetical protein
MCLWNDSTTRAPCQESVTQVRFLLIAGHGCRGVHRYVVAVCGVDLWNITIERSYSDCKSLLL